MTSTDAEQTFDKIKHPLMIKNSQKKKTRGKSQIDSVYKISTANIL